MKFNSSTKLFSWYYFIIISIVLVIGVASSVFTFIKVSGSTQGVLLKDVASIVSVFETSSILALKGEKSDLENPAYISLKTKLERIPELNTDVRFAYLWGYRDGNPFFFVDSEPADSPDYSPPGQIYEEATELNRDMFLKKLPSGIEISSDRWGTWLTALTPIFNEDTGDVIAVMGMDMSASNYYRTVYVYTAIPVITTIFVLILIMIGFVLRKREQEFLAFKSELVSIASHEIRSPLTGISWLTDGILRGSEQMSDQLKTDIATIKDKSGALLRTINDLLEGATAERINKRKFTKESILIKALFQDLIKDSLLSIEEKKLKLNIDASITPELTIAGDSDKIKRMFNNLISNAIKYSKDGGTVTLGKIDKDPHVIFWVKDEGIGIPDKDQWRIFKGFFRAENAKKITNNGTGLGLHYVRQIAELHNGKVWCESQENSGSTFFIELPKV